MIDINCDMGESVGNQIIGQDEKLMPFITSCNIACGFHGGDDFHMRKTINLALKYNVRMGAHPSYPDLEGFGRRPMDIEKSELKELIVTQIEILKGLVEGYGGELRYVKPHGALYNKASKNKEETETIIEAIQSVDPNLAFMGLAGSAMEVAANEKEISFIAEAFCDRKYEADARLPYGQGSLMSRSKTGSVYSSVKDVVSQVESIVFENEVEVGEGHLININADSICIHGDNPIALDFLRAIREMFKTRQIGN